MTPTPVRRRRTGRLAPAGLLAVAVLAVSSSAVLARWADAPAVSLAFWRTAGGALLLAPLVRHRRTGRVGPVVPAVPWPLVGVAGAALAVHFATWLASLELTSVAASVTLVSTAPVFVALHLVLSGHRPSRRVMGAIALALAGTLVITGGDTAAEDQSLAGDGLALSGAAAMAAYLVAGARARATMSTAAYATRTYAVAALCLLAVALAGGRALTGYDGRTWLAIAGMVLGPQLAGHTLFNHLLVRFGAVTVSLALLLEPVGAAWLTWLAFGELPPGPVWLGAPLVLIGLAAQVLAPRPAASRVARPAGGGAEATGEPSASRVRRRRAGSDQAGGDAR